MSLLLSVIVPVYNVEPYLGECLESLLGQSLDGKDYEILLIDDKSTDNSLAICREYERRHNTIRVFPLPENSPGWVGVPCNVGIKNAVGEYVGIVDSDDVFLPEMFAELTAGALAEDADLALCSFAMLQSDGTLQPPYDEEFWAELFTPGFAGLAEVEQKHRYLKIAPVYWRKVYRREFLLRNRLFFPVRDHPFEDIYFHWASILPAGRIAKTDKRLAVYRTQREAKLTNREAGEAAMHQTVYLGLVREMLLKRNLLAVYREPYLHLAADILSRVPEDNEKYTTVKATILGLCEGLAS